MKPEQAASPEEIILRRIPAEIVVLAACLALSAWLLFDAMTGLLFFAGGVLSAVGFAWLRQSLTRFLSREKKGALRAGIALYIVRLMLICAVFFLIIVLYPKKILAFAAGFSTIVPVSLLEGLRGLLLMRKWKD
jgi:hypothetical protein